MSVKTLLLNVIPCESFLKKDELGNKYLLCKTPCEFHKASKTTKIVFFEEEIARIKAVYPDKELNFNGCMLKAENKCPFLKKSGFCELHFTSLKPLCCIFSPFTFNKHGTLIYRYRYYQFPCYKNKELPRLPAYKAFKKSLVDVFGGYTYSIICQEVLKGKDFHVGLDTKLYNKIIDADRRRKEAI